MVKTFSLSRYKTKTKTKTRKKQHWRTSIVLSWGRMNKGTALRQDCKRAELFSHLQASELACHNFRDVCRIWETPVSETEDLITQNTVSSLSISIFLSVLLTFKSKRGSMDEYKWMPLHVGGCIIEEEPYASGIWIAYWTEMPSLCSQAIFSYLSWIVKMSALSSTRRYYLCLTGM